MIHEGVTLRGGHLPWPSQGYPVRVLCVLELWPTRFLQAPLVPEFDCQWIPRLEQ